MTNGRATGGRIGSDSDVVLARLDPYCSYVIPWRDLPAGFDPDALKRLNGAFCGDAKPAD